ncbi:MAG: hypothetical protein H6620_06310 [Halobacteriovoraceae bacterium]|nr:hypothetical protein [Halobacteriovoraceae bacterium]
MIKLTKVFIFILHIVLLAWILYALYFSHNLSTKELLIHFVGIGLMGAFLIRFTILFGRKEFRKEVSKKRK